MTRKALVQTMLAGTAGMALAETGGAAENAARADDTTAFPVSVTVDAGKPVGEMRPVWRFFGADEPNYATMKDGKKLLNALGELSHQTAYFRTHNLLTTGDGTPALKWGSTNIYTEDAHGKPVYDWTIVDHIFDTYRAHGVQPYVQIGFMPQALSTHPVPYQHHWTPEAKYDEIYTGWAYPPTDYGKWAELVYQWVTHCVARYNKAEVEKWYWQTWNEPNIGYWRGTPEEFRKLHDYAIDAVRRALPTARVGGPDMAGGGGKQLHDFLEHSLRGTNHATGKVGTPLDFVSFHAKGAPRFADDHVVMGIAAQLKTIDQTFAQIAGFPELKNTPIVIGECDPDGCAACQGPPLAYRMGTLYSSYTAASLAREYLLADRHGVHFEGALTWAFEFEGYPYFAPFRVLATRGIDLPVLNVFRMLGKMEGERLSVTSSGEVALDDIVQNGVRGERPDVSALAARADKRVTVLLWHYHDADVPGPRAEVSLALQNLPGPAVSARIRHFRIDENHSNAFTLWKQMGQPQSPRPAQYKELEQAGKLAEAAAPTWTGADAASGTLHLALPRQAVVLVTLDWK